MKHPAPMVVLTVAIAAALAAPAAHAQAHDHAQASQPVDPHAGHATPPGEPVPPLTPADRAAAFPDVGGHAVHDDAIHSYWLVDHLEAWDADTGGTGVAWEAIAWIGGDIARVWLRTDGEQVGGVLESAAIDVLYGRAVAPWWDVVAGVRHESGEGPSRTFAAFGVQGLTPHGFELSATGLVGQGGHTAAQLEVEHDTLLTNRLILQSLAGIEIHGRDDPLRGIGAGLGTIEAGLRLRYEIRREFAPYVGVAWERAHGATADLRRAASGDVEDTRFVAGVRFWF